VRIAAHHHLPHADAALLTKALDDRGRKEDAALVQRIATLAAAPVNGGAELVSRAREIDAALAAATKDELGPK